MAYRYNRINWQNKPNVATPISAENLNKMDKGIDDNDKAIGDLVQLNTLNKSSLVSAVNELNNNLATQYGTLMPGDFDLSNPSPSYNYVKKSGKVVQLGIDINVNSVNGADSAKLICTLPADFRPSRNMYLVGRAVVDGKFTAVYVYIYTSGGVNVVLPAGTTTAIGFNTSWIMD